jgi:hypothetical protein
LAIWGFVPECSVTFSNIYIQSYTTDASDSYSVSIYNVGTGAVVCSPSSATTGVPTQHSVMTFACQQGSVSLTGGTLYAIVTTGTATTGQFNSAGVDTQMGLVYDIGASPQLGLSSSGGLISGTLTATPTMAVYTAGIPTFNLH